MDQPCHDLPSPHPSIRFRVRHRVVTAKVTSLECAAMFAALFRLLVIDVVGMASLPPVDGSNGLQVVVAAAAAAAAAAVDYCVGVDGPCAHRQSVRRQPFRHHRVLSSRRR